MAPFWQMNFRSWGSTGCQGLAQNLKRGHSTSECHVGHIWPSGGMTVAEDADAIHISRCVIRAIMQMVTCGRVRDTDVIMP